MIMKFVTIVIILLSLALPAFAQDADKPTVAFLRAGASGALKIIEDSILTSLQAWEFISTEERELAYDRQELTGEAINIIWGDAGADLTNAPIVVERALDQGADILVTLTTPMTLSAINATSDMEDPPAVLFGWVFHPYESGIAQASCLKPDHVTGTIAQTNYADALPMLMMQNPDMEKIGVIFSASESSGIYGVDQISEIAESLGLAVETAAATDISQLRLAAEGLASKDVEAFVLPLDMLTDIGIPIISNVANENGIPLFHPIMGSVRRGATISAGFSLYFEEAKNLGGLLVTRLRGEIDIAETGIISTTDLGVGVNLDMAEEQGITISEELLAMADMVVEDGDEATSSAYQAKSLESLGFSPAMINMVLPFMGDWDIDEELSPESLALVIQISRSKEAEAKFRELLDNGHCSAEKIAEQQAALEAAE